MYVTFQTIPSLCLPVSVVQYILITVPLQSWHNKHMSMLCKLNDLNIIVFYKISDCPGSRVGQFCTFFTNFYKVQCRKLFLNLTHVIQKTFILSDQPIRILSDQTIRILSDQPIRILFLCCTIDPCCRYAAIFSRYAWYSLECAALFFSRPYTEEAHTQYFWIQAVQ